MKKTRIGVLVTLVALATSTSLLATLDQQKLFKTKYPEAKGLQKCSTCHTAALPKKDGDHAANAFGKDIVKYTSKDKTSIDWAKIEPLDSDGDGVSNIDEINKGTNPGDPKSK